MTTIARNALSGGAAGTRPMLAPGLLLASRQ
jgi:hypothetical protein